jgi:hypothetical protein
VDAGAAAPPERDLSRRVRVRHVVDAEAALEPGLRPVGGLRLAVDEHDAAGRPDLVRVRAARHGQGGQRAWPRGVAHVDQGRAVRGAHLRDERHVAVDDDPPAARTVEVADLLDAASAHERPHAVVIRAACDLATAGASRAGIRRRRA